VPSARGIRMVLKKRVKPEVVRSGRGMGSECPAAAAGQAPQPQALDEPPVWPMEELPPAQADLHGNGSGNG